MTDDIQISVKMPSSNERLKIIHSGIEITDLKIARNNPGRPCGPILLVEENSINFDSISNTEK